MDYEELKQRNRNKTNLFSVAQITDFLERNATIGEKELDELVDILINFTQFSYAFGYDAGYEDAEERFNPKTVS